MSKVPPGFAEQMRREALERGDAEQAHYWSLPPDEREKLAHEQAHEANAEAKKAGFANVAQHNEYKITVTKERIRRRVHRELNAEEATPDVPLRWTTAEERAARPPMVWLVERLVPERGVGVAFGRMGTGKSLLFDVDLGLSLVNGLPTWMGFAISQPTRRHVGVVLMEGVPGFPGRERAWLAGHKNCTGEGLLTFEYQPVDLGSKEFMPRFVESIKVAKVGARIDAQGNAVGGVAFNPVLLIVDTQGLAAPAAEESSRNDLRRVYQLCKWLADALGCFVLLITHPGHQFPHRPAGSSTQEQDADLSIRVQDGWLEVNKVKEGEPGARRFFEFVKPEGEASVYVRHVEADTNLGRAAAREAERHHRIVCAVRQLQGAGGTPRSKVYEVVGGNRQTFFRTVDALVAQGRLRASSNGGAPLVSTTEEVACD